MMMMTMTTMTMMMTRTMMMMMTNLHHHQKNLKSPKNPRRMNYRRTPAPTTFQSKKPFYNLFGAINDFDT